MRVLSNINEWRLTLIAWIQGRRGVLDDLGNLIESDAEATESPVEFIETESSADLEDSPSELEINPFDSSPKPVWTNRLKLVFKLIFWAGIMFLSLRFSWIFTGWVGNKLLNLPGALGNLVGLVVIVAGFFVWAVASERLDHARAFRRSTRGERNVHDRLSIYSFLHLYKICPSCSFSFKNHLDDEQDIIRCSECSAQWIPQNWIGFLTVDRTGAHKDLKRKSTRRASCLIDARDQMYVVLNNCSRADRKKRIQNTQTRGVWKSQLLAVLCFLPLIGAVIAAMLWIISFSKGNQTLLIGSVFIVILIAIMIIVFRTYLDTARNRRIKQLGLDMIEEGLCGCCGVELDREPHVVDGAIACDACGLFFDPQTDAPKHHCRRRIPWERYKTDPVFTR